MRQKIYIFRSFFVLEYDNRSLFQFARDGRLLQCVDDKMAFPGQGIEVVKNKIFCSMHNGFFVYSK